MIQVSEEQIKDFLEKEFPGQPYSLGQGYWLYKLANVLEKICTMNIRQKKCICTLKDLIGAVSVITFGLM